MFGGAEPAVCASLYSGQSCARACSNVFAQSLACTIRVSWVAILQLDNGSLFFGQSTGCLSVSA